MIQKIINWFKKPYYFNPKLIYKFMVSLGFGVSIFLFLYIFEPFRMSELSNDSFIYSFGYGLITFSTMLTTTLILPFIFPKLYNNINWSISKHFIYIASTTLLISIANWYYNTQVQIGGSSILSLPTMVVYTFSIGLFPILLYLYIDERYSRGKREKIASELNKELGVKVTKPLEKITITLYSDETKEVLTFDVNKLVYVSSLGNYASVFLLENNTIIEKVIRTTLSKIEKELSEQKSIIRCHKSYIVNSIYIKSVSGNARGYLLKSDTFPFEIPVSRKYKKQDLMKLIQV